MRATATARRMTRAAHLQAEADAWLEGGREQFDALLERVRRGPTGPDAERASLQGLAVIGAALVQALRTRGGTEARRPRRRRRPA